MGTRRTIQVSTGASNARRSRRDNADRSATARAIPTGMSGGAADGYGQHRERFPRNAITSSDESHPRLLRLRPLRNRVRHHGARLAIRRSFGRRCWVEAPRRSARLAGESDSGGRSRRARNQTLHRVTAQLAGECYARSSWMIRLGMRRAPGHSATPPRVPYVRARHWRRFVHGHEVPGHHIANRKFCIGRRWLPATSPAPRRGRVRPLLAECGRALVGHRLGRARSLGPMCD
jgi:hypothetical protein